MLEIEKKSVYLNDSIGLTQLNNLLVSKVLICYYLPIVISLSVIEFLLKDWTDFNEFLYALGGDLDDLNSQISP